MLDLLAGSQLIRSELDGRHTNDGQRLIQDRYSLRCLPQYLGPIVDGLAQIGQALQRYFPQGLVGTPFSPPHPPSISVFGVWMQLWQSQKP